MRDARIALFRKTLEGLIESLDATVRLTRWTGGEGIPEPLKESASQLVVRLGTAHRLTSSSFAGSVLDQARVNVMLVAMRRLDAAYVVYRQGIERAPRENELASAALNAEVDEVKGDARWQA
jgi:hypothetical protein